MNGAVYSKLPLLTSLPSGCFNIVLLNPSLYRLPQKQNPTAGCCESVQQILTCCAILRPSISWELWVKPVQSLQTRTTPWLVGSWCVSHSVDISWQNAGLTGGNTPQRLIQICFFLVLWLLSLWLLLIVVVTAGCMAKCPVGIIKTPWNLI